LFSPSNFQVENEMSSVRERYGEAFWRAHHEAWVQGELNQREYCEAYGIPLKAFGNWRAKFKAEPQTPARKVLYRRGGLSHTLSHSLSHMTYDRTASTRGASAEVKRSGQAPESGKTATPAEIGVAQGPLLART
jgi:hypothetical protein